MMDAVLVSPPTPLLSAAFSVAGLSLLLLPSRSSRRRLARMVRMPSESESKPGVRRVLGRSALVVAVLALLLMTVLLGPALPVACGLVSFAIGKFWTAQRRSRAELTRLSELETTVRTMAEELRVGAHPVAAVEAAVGEANNDLAEELRIAATAERLGDDPGVAPVPNKRGEHGDDVLAQVTAAWMLARRHGVPLVGIVEAVQHDVESTSRLLKQTEARMAGPRTSAAILAVLPLAGIALGEAMNAGPSDVLLTTSTGQVLLVVGTAFIAVGTWWSMVLTGRGRRR